MYKLLSCLLNHPKPSFVSKEEVSVLLQSSQRATQPSETDKGSKWASSILLFPEKEAKSVGLLKRGGWFGT
jgi:hypothetical protein